MGNVIPEGKNNGISFPFPFFKRSSSFYLEKKELGKEGGKKKKKKVPDMDDRENDGPSEEGARLPPITIAEDDEREYENRCKAWDVVIKAASDIERISCDAQRKNTSLNEAELVHKLSTLIATVCKEQLLPIIPPLTENAPDILPGLSMAADLHHTTNASCCKIPELVNPKFVHEQNASALEQHVTVVAKRGVPRPRTNTKCTNKDSVQINIIRNPPKQTTVLETTECVSMQKSKTTKHKQNTFEVLKDASPAAQPLTATTTELHTALPTKSSSPPPSSSSSSLETNDVCVISNQNEKKRDVFKDANGLHRLDINSEPTLNTDASTRASNTKAQTCYFIFPSNKNVNKSINTFPSLQSLDVIKAQALCTNSATSLTQQQESVPTVLTTTLQPKIAAPAPTTTVKFHTFFASPSNNK